MDKSELISGIIFIIGVLTFYFWSKRYLKNKVAESGKTEEFKRNKAQMSAFLYPLIGLVLIAMIVFQWRTLPPGNEPIAFIFIGLGFTAILYGLFKGLRSSKVK